MDMAWLMIFRDRGSSIIGQEEDTRLWMERPLCVTHELPVLKPENRT